MNSDDDRVSSIRTKYKEMRSSPSNTTRAETVNSIINLWDDTYKSHRGDEQKIFQVFHQVLKEHADQATNPISRLTFIEARDILSHTQRG